MAELEVTTTTGRQAAVAGNAVDAFRASLRGGTLRRGDPGYDEARSVFNAMIDRYPALIVRCAGAGDVIGAVKFAARHDLLVSVREGSDLSVRQTLRELGVNRATFYAWYRRYQAQGDAGLTAKAPAARRYWNRIPPPVRSSALLTPLGRVRNFVCESVIECRVPGAPPPARRLAPCQGLCRLPPARFASVSRRIGDQSPRMKRSSNWIAN